MALKLTNIGGALNAFFRTLGSVALPTANEAILATHLEDLNGRPLGMLSGQALNAQQYGLLAMVQNDNNALPLRGDRFGGVATAQIQLLLSWLVEGTAFNTRMFFTYATTMAQTQTAQGVTLNSGNINTASSSFQVVSFLQIPQHMKGPTLMRMRMRVSQWGVANAAADFGYALSSANLGQTPNLTGVYWRFDSAGVVPVFAYNGSVVAIGVDVSALLVNTNFYNWGIIRDDDQYVFTVQETTSGKVLSRQTLQVPAGQAKAFAASHAQPYLRTFNGAVAPVTGTQLIYSEWTLGVLDANFNMTAPQLQTGLGLGSENGPLNYTTTSNLQNSTVAPTTVPSNTVATVTALDGAIRVAGPGGSTSDAALFSYTCPANYRYRCKRVRVAAKNLGAIVATTPTQIDFFLCVNGLGVTLIGNLNRKYIGTQTFPVGAAIGAGAVEGPISLDLTEADLLTEAGRTVTLMSRTSTGTATGGQVIEIMYSNLGHFE